MILSVRPSPQSESLKPGSWTSVEALSLLAVEIRDRSYLDEATRTAATLKPGTWEAVRVLALLARAEREIG